MMMKLAASGIPYAALKEPLVLVRKNSQHMQMTRELEAVQKGRLNKLQLTLDWLGENGITKFKHLTSQAYKNNQTWAMFELANHQGLSGLPLLLKAILTNPLYAIRKFIYLAPQAIQKRIDRS